MVSVIIPTYNRANTLGRAVKSVLEQTIRQVEIIIVDDASTDDTRQIVERFDDPRIRYIKLPENRGACAARNIGIDQAKGEFIAFQDSDDEWHSDKLAIQLNAIQKQNADVVTCAYYQIRGGQRRKIPEYEIDNHEILTSLLWKNFIGTPTILGKRHCFVDEPFDANIPRYQDWELMLRIVKKYKVFFINSPLVTAYLQENCITMDQSIRDETFACAVVKKHMDVLEKNAPLLTHYYRWIAYLKRINKDYSVNYYAQALKSGGFNLKLFLRSVEFEIKRRLSH